ncbi:MAG: hypothetical protein Q8906_16550, partial [Bacillota bacterium]|nr:hypothetical protein [Bacillota bacterium]
MNTLKKYKLELGLILIYLLPPIGIGAFLVTGWTEIVHTIKKKNMKLSSTSIFFFMLLVSSVGSSIILHSPKNLLITFLILGYWGIYLKGKKSFSLSLFNRIKTIAIYGGIYSVFSGFLKPILTKYFILGFFTGSVYLGSQAPDTPRLIGNAFNPNFTAFLLLLSFIFLLADIVYKFAGSKKRVTFARMILLAILIWGLYETASRSIIICMFVLILTLIIRLNKKIGYFS